MRRAGPEDGLERFRRQFRSKRGVRLAQKMQVGPRNPVGIQLLMAEVGPTSGPTSRLSHSSGSEKRLAVTQRAKACGTGGIQPEGDPSNPLGVALELRLKSNSKRVDREK